MLQLPTDLGLLDEPPRHVGSVDIFLEQHLHGQVAAEIDVATAQHGPHAAPGDLAGELVAVAGLVPGRHGVGCRLYNERALALGLFEYDRPRVADARAWRAG